MTTENNTNPSGTPGDKQEGQPQPPAGAAGPGLEIGTQPAIVVPSTGDPALDIAVKFFATAGISPASEEMALAKAGDFSLLRAKVAEKGVAGGDQYVAVMESVHTRNTEAAKAVKAAAEAVVVGVVGSQENWAAVKNFAAQTASEAELAEINAALKAGGVTARATAMYLKSAYEKATGLSLSGAQAAPASSGGGAPPTNQPSGLTPLSPPEYRKLVGELAAEVGANRVDADPRYAQLKARRSAWRG